jgi:hypothetical protein
MTRFLLILSFVAISGLSLSAQEARTTPQSLSPEEARLVQMSNDCVHFESRLMILKGAYQSRETARVIAYHQLLLDAMRVEIDQAMEAGEAQKNILESLTHIMNGLEGHSFDFGKPQEAEATFGQLEKFLAVMKDVLIAETEKSANGIHLPGKKQ